MFFFEFKTHGQTTVTFGTGTNDSTNYGPIYRSSSNNGFTDSRYAYQYTATELTNLGITSGSQIQSIGFYKTTTATLSNNTTMYGSFSIYLKNTTNTSLVNGTTWGTLITDATLVNTTYYTANNNFPGIGWITYPCTVPFVYTGGTLEVYVKWHLVPGTAAQPLSTGAFEWLYTNYSTNVTIGATPNNTGMNNSTTLGLLTYGGTRRPNMQLTYSSAITCSGIPTPGNTIASNTSPCPGTSILVSIQNLVNHVGTTYQWYDSSGVISGATNAIYTPIVTTNNIYYCGVTCSGNTEYSTPVSISVASFLNCYCSSNATGSNKEKINSVTITTPTNSLNNNSICISASGFYSDYTVSVPSLVLHHGDTNFVSLFVDYCFASGVVPNNNTSALWIDYNHNGMFELDERVYVTLNPSNGLPYYTGPHTETGSFIIPTTALYGPTRMRIICRNGVITPLTNACGAYGLGETEDYLVDIQPTTTTTLNVTMFVQGYMNSSNTMVPVLANQGVPSITTACDSITLELRTPTAPYTVMQSIIVILDTNGFATCTLPFLSGSYYIVIKHRNILETWSASPVLMAPVVNYNFTTSASQTYGLNQVQISPGIYALYSGDLNNDENIDLIDLGILENDIPNFSSGYFATDINGDGNVDLLDMPIVENNINNFIFSHHP